MRTALDDQLGALDRRQSAHVGDALLGDEDVDVVFGVIDVEGLRDDPRDCTVVQRGGGSAQTVTSAFRL